MRILYTFTRLASASRLLWIPLLAAPWTVLPTATCAAASFSYHGTLQDRGHPADGSYDLELTLYSAAAGGRALGGPLQLYAVPVRDGSFATQADFGPLANVSGTAWLGVKVRPAGSSDYVALSARAPVSADITAATSSVCPGAWTIAGNAGNPAGSYLGTADYQPLVFEIDGIVAGRLVPGPDPLNPQRLNVIFGSGNTLLDAAALATIGGGNLNSVASSATIAGGTNNHATGAASAIIGGVNNEARGDYSVAPGGLANVAGGDFSFAGGHNARVRDAQQTASAGGDQGTFAWNDSAGVVMTSSGPDQFLIRAGGGVAINDTPPNHDVELTIEQSAADTSGQASIYMRQSSSHAGVLVAAGGASADPGNDATFFVYNYNPAAPGAPAVQELALAGGNLTIAGNAYKPGGGSWNTPSDRRIKHDVAPIGNAVDTLLRLQPVSFRYNADYRAQAGGFDDKAYLGFVAQDYAQVFPEAVTATRQQVPGASGADTPILALDPSPAVITTVAAVQELAVDSRAQSAELARLRRENASMRAALDDLRARLGRLEHGEGR